MVALRRIRMNIYVQMMLWLFMGLTLFILHDDTAKLYCFILGVILMIQGLPQLILFMVERTRFLYSFIMLVSGFFTSILGVISITLEHDAFAYLPSIIGFAMLTHAIKEALMLFYIKQQTYSNWRFLVFLTCLTVCTALTLIIMTLMMKDIGLRLTGILMVCDAVIESLILYIGEEREPMESLQQE